MSQLRPWCFGTLGFRGAVGRLGIEVAAGNGHWELRCSERGARWGGRTGFPPRVVRAPDSLAANPPGAPATPPEALGFPDMTRRLPSPK